MVDRPKIRFHGCDDSRTKVSSSPSTSRFAKAKAERQQKQQHASSSSSSSAGVVHQEQYLGLPGSLSFDTIPSFPAIGVDPQRKNYHIVRDDLGGDFGRAKPLSAPDRWWERDLATRRQMLYDMANSVPEPEPSKPVCENEDGDGDGDDKAVVSDDDEAVVNGNDEAVVSDDDEAVVSDDDEAVVSDDDDDNEAVVSDHDDEAVIPDDDDQDEDEPVMDDVDDGEARVVGRFGICSTYASNRVESVHKTYERHGQPSMMNTLNHLEEQLEMHRRNHKQMQNRLKWLSKNRPDDDDAMDAAEVWMEYHLREWKDTRARAGPAYRDYTETKPIPKKMVVRWDLCKPVEDAASSPKTTPKTKTTPATAAGVEAPVNPSIGHAVPQKINSKP